MLSLSRSQNKNVIVIYLFRLQRGENLNTTKKINECSLKYISIDGWNINQRHCLLFHRTELSSIDLSITYAWGFPGDSDGTESACNEGDPGSVPGSELGLGLWEGPLEKEMEAHSSIPAWRIPWTEEPGGLQSMGSPRVTDSWATNT